MVKLTYRCIRISPSASSYSIRMMLFKVGEEDPGKTTGHAAMSCMCPNFEDSIYLGQAGEKVLFSDSRSDMEALQVSIKELSARVKEVFPRCERVDRKELEYKMGLRIDLDKDAPTLDPSEDVDESNWRERGYFRKTSTTTEQSSAASNGATVDENSGNSSST